MATLDIIALSELLPEFEELILDRLPMSDIRNLTKVSNLHMQMVQKFARLREDKFGALLAKAIVVKKSKVTSSLVDSSTKLSHKAIGLFKLRGSFFDVDLIDLETFALQEVKSKENASVHGIISNNKFHALVFVKWEEDDDSEMSFEVVDRKGNCVQDMKVNIGKYEHIFDDFSLSSKCNFIVFAELCTDQVLKIMVIELTENAVAPLRVREKTHYLNEPKRVKHITSYNHFALITTEDSSIMVFLDENDIKIREHFLENAQFLRTLGSCTFWTIIDSHYCQQLKLIDVKTGRQFMIEKDDSLVQSDMFSSFHYFVEFLAVLQDMFDERKTCLIQCLDDPDKGRKYHFTLLRNCSGKVLSYGFMPLKENNLYLHDIHLFGNTIFAGFVDMDVKKLGLLTFDTNSKEYKLFDVKEMGENNHLSISANEKSLKVIHFCEKKLTVTNHIWKRPYSLAE